MQYWLMKSEPEAYAYSDLIREKVGTWDGVRNHQAKRNLAAMKPGDLALFYHSVSDKAVVGIMRIKEGPAADPTDPTGQWIAVKVEPVRAVDPPITLAQIKAVPALADIPLIKQSRLSVMPLTKADYEAILAIGG